jgi:cytochrome c oxidase subunit IV
MSLNELERVKSIAIAQRQYLIVWCSIFIWDTLCTLRLEQRVIWKARWTLMKALYLLNRYGSLLICIASWITVFVPMSNGKLAAPYLAFVLLTDTCITVSQLLAVKFYGYSSLKSSTFSSSLIQFFRSDFTQSSIRTDT